MSDLNSTLQLYGYGSAGITYLVLSILLLTKYRGWPRSGSLSMVTLLSAVCVFSLALVAIERGLSSPQIFFIEMLHDAGWLVFLSALLGGAVGFGQLSAVRYGAVLLPAGLLAIGAGLEFVARYDPQVAGAGSIIVPGSLLTSLYAIIVIEQVYRNTRASQRRSVKYLCLGVGGIFTYDLFMYSNVILFGQTSELFWIVRGVVVAMCVPMIGIAIIRDPNWSTGIFLSRRIVFHAATVLGAGIYLTIVGFAGFYLRNIGSDWGSAAQLIVLAAGIIGLSVFLISDNLRGRLKVFISKHFFENRYDYREEWLRLIETLTSPTEALPLKKRAIRALAQIVKSADGLLWLLRSESSGFVCVAGWNRSANGQEIDRELPLPQYLDRTGWVIEMREYKSDPDRYPLLDFENLDLGVEEAEFVIPLIHDSHLLGFVVLSQPNAAIVLNYEDRDLLKTAGKQIASYLAQELATEQLSEHRQFEAFNRLTAYLMHDLKNLVAQQSLVVENAQKHKSNPDFVEDVIGTVKNSVLRMRRVIDHLQQGTSIQSLQRVELGKLIMQAVSECADFEPVPRAKIGDNQVWVRADGDRLQMALYHAIRNAQDATDKDGSVTVELTSDGAEGCVRIVDNGEGMDEEFIRERLFKPFDSTKGSQGMGMGAYQLRETVRALGGIVLVDSVPGRGTCVSLSIKEKTRE